MVKKIVWCLLACVLSSAVLAQNGKKSLSLESIVDGEFRQDVVEPWTFMADGEHYAKLIDREKVVKYELATGKEVEVLLSPKHLEWQGKIDGFTFSKNNHFILFYTDRQKIYRHSFSARYYLYDVRLKKLKAVADGELVRAAMISPDASKLAYVKNNNIFIYNNSFSTTRQITEDGEINAIINGVPDWVYEEEFATDRMMEWSPDSRFLAWVRFDESQVPEFAFDLYNPKKESGKYIDRYVYKYPRAGAKNSEVAVKVFDYKTKVTRQMDVERDNGDFYIPRIYWTKQSDKLGVATLNRHQNNLQLLWANPKSGICSVVLSEDNDCYVDQQSYSNIVFLEDGEHFVYQSEKDGYNHLYLYTLAGRMVRQLTQGAYDVTAFYGYDAKHKKYYFQAAKETPLERQVYSLDSRQRLSCIMDAPGTNAIKFSPKYHYSLRFYSAIDKPLEVALYDAKQRQLYTLVDNEKLKKRMTDYQYATKEFLQVQGAEGDTLNAWMIKPLSFDEAQAYPLVMVQYSGPGSQQVANSFSFGWEYYLAQQGYVVLCVDGRGTGFRGEAFKKCTYQQLGRYESDDQIAVAKYMASLPYIDQDKIGIWGWSYGGFMTSLCLSRGEGVFHAGIAVAPVTHYRYYDSAYTERFMRTPAENPDGYENYAPINLADQLQGRLLLCHGTADDNVHYQNTIDYAEALVQAGKQFEMQVYRDRNHSIYGGNTRQHLYHRFMDFYERYLK